MKGYDTPSKMVTENPQISICLNCPKATCNYGTCDLVRGMNRDYIVKRIWTTKKGEKKMSYLLREPYENKIQTTTEVNKAVRRTEKGARELVKRAMKCVPSNVKFEIVRKVEEDEKIYDEKY